MTMVLASRAEDSRNAPLPAGFEQVRSYIYQPDRATGATARVEALTQEADRSIVESRIRHELAEQGIEIVDDEMNSGS